MGSENRVPPNPIISNNIEWFTIIFPMNWSFDVPHPIPIPSTAPPPPMGHSPLAAWRPRRPGWSRSRRRRRGRCWWSWPRPWTARPGERRRTVNPVGTAERICCWWSYLQAKRWLLMMINDSCGLGVHISGPQNKQTWSSFRSAIVATHR